MHFAAASLAINAAGSANAVGGAPVTGVSLLAWLALILAGLAIWFATTALLRRRRALEAAVIVGQSYDDYVLEVLVNVAKIDGAVADAERQAIFAFMAQLKGLEPDRAGIEHALSVARLSKEQLLAYLATKASEFSADQKLQLLKGVLNVIAADGRFEGPEQETLMDYIEAMGFDRKQAPSVLQELIRMPASGNYV